MADPVPAPLPSFVDTGGLRRRVLHWPGAGLSKLPASPIPSPDGAGAVDARRAVQAVTDLALKPRGVDRATRAMRDLRVAWMDTNHDISLHRPVELAGLLLEFAARVGASA